MKAGAAGGIEVVVKAINTHVDNTNVCEQGCGALMSMTNNGKNTEKTKKMNWVDENRVKAGAAGGIEVVVKAIDTHTNGIGVCQNGCGALNNMTANVKAQVKHSVLVK